MAWDMLDRDPITGVERWLYFEDGKLLGMRFDVPNVDPLLEANAEAEKATHGRRFGDWNRIASVPLVLLEKSGLDTAVDMRDDKFISKWMNDPDHQKFRTSRGNV